MKTPNALYRLTSRSTLNVERDSTRDESISTRRHSRAPWTLHVRKVLYACSLVTVPMFAFTIALSWLVFANRVDLNHCPYPNLCRNFNSQATLEGRNYFVDFPVGRLAFVSSLSATLSFTLIAAFMAMYGHTVARQLMETTRNEHRDNLPSPHNLAVIVRLLNAEVFLLGDLFLEYVSQRFRRSPATKRERRSERSDLTRACLVVLSLGILVR